MIRVILSYVKSILFSSRTHCIDELDYEPNEYNLKLVKKPDRNKIRIIKKG